MASSQTLTEIDVYLESHSRSARIEALKVLSAQGEKLPIALAEDLLTLEIDLQEKAEVLEATDPTSGLPYEHFLTSELEDWHQNLSSLAVRLWAERSDHLLWFRLLALVQNPIVPQRVRYTVLDQAQHTGGRRVIETIQNMEGLDEMSPAFHGLLLERAVGWGVESEQLLGLAHTVLASLKSHPYPDQKALPSALAYMARFSPETLAHVATDATLSHSWRDLARSVYGDRETNKKTVEKLTRLAGKPPKTKPFERLSRLWPPVWSRHELSSTIVRCAFELVDSAGGTDDRGFFAGIPERTLVEAVTNLTDDATLGRTLRRLDGYLETPTSDNVREALKSRLSSSEDPATLLSALPLRIRLELTENETSAEAASEFQRLKAEENTTLERKAPESPAEFHEEAKRGGSQETVARKRFFDVAYHNGQPEVPHPPQGFWDLLTDSWLDPQESKIADLATAARQTQGVFRLCYIKTLGRFSGCDEAALKLLDFIRSQEPDELKAVIHALGGIATPRATQELISALTRPNVTHSLQLEICNVLEHRDLSNLQKELRSAINDLRVHDESEHTHWEVREAISRLLDPVSETSAAAPNTSGTTEDEVAVSDRYLDQALKGKIQNYGALSSEVKRALRTSQFFHTQVTGTTAPESIDLSPVIDMQYKALELLFRETFENPCTQLIHTGVLQRKLDIIGYARPIPKAMDEFEKYVSSLPIIKDIPFFSKFKLRKMLRAICQFRPGRRFTLDGLKAFALFFLCFGRTECRYGLERLFPLGFDSDEKLFEFCKSLHTLQDFRNRAAHEGFHPDASNDIDGIWQTTAEVIQTVDRVRETVEAFSANQHAPKNRSEPVIQRKTS